MLLLALLTPGSEGVLFLHLHLLPAARRDVVVDPLVVVVHSHRQHLLGIRLANYILIQVGIDLVENEQEM